MTGFGASMGNSLGKDCGAGTGRDVPPWKLGVSAGAMMGRGNP